MVASLWDIAQALIGTAVLAIQTPTTPIPQSFDYSALASYQIHNGHFSTGSLGQPRVAAIATAVPQLEAFIINNSPCGNLGIPITYRLYIRNSGAGAATEITVQNQYPDRTNLLSVARTPDAIDPATRLLTWRESGLTAGNFLQYTLTVSSVPGTLTDVLTVDYFDDNPVVVQRQHFRTQTSHTLDDKNCQGGLAPTSPLPQNKSAAIICDPAEIGCQKFLPSLGIRFQNAKSFADNPVLGKRFQEAVADILPGECSVVADDIISTPQYQDALNRKGKPADAFIEPLYQSGQDFKKLVHENTLLGIPLFAEIQRTLQTIHTKHWQKQVPVLQSVLENKTTTQHVRSLIDRWSDEWVQETKQAQQTFAIRYGQLQQQRKGKFDPVAQQAITNANLSIGRACGQASDGGLAALLPPVKKTYEDSLAERQRLFNDTQALFADSDSAKFDVKYRSSTWKRELREALDAFDRGNSKLLKTYIQEIPQKDQGGFEVSFRLTYTKHMDEDKDSDEKVRLQSWEVALDTPKTVATVCEKKKVFGPPVETSWCESGTYPEVLFKPTPAPLRSALPPDTSSLDGTKAKIDVRQVRGQVCGGKPGDPWWAAGCVCQCNDAIATGAVDANGVPLLFACQSGQPIVLHDIRVTSKEECLAELNKHRHGSDLERF